MYFFFFSELAPFIFIIRYIHVGLCDAPSWKKLYQYDRHCPDLWFALGILGLLGVFTLLSLARAD